MIKSVNKYLISELFPSDNNRISYVVPRYQREYSWGVSQWEELFDDIHENDTGYFLGSIICINQNTDALQISKLEVVDGQQRLTTISILFCALYESLKKLNSEDEELKHELFNLKNKLVLKSTKEELRITPQQQNNNLNDYLSVLHETGVIQYKEKPSNAGNRRIYKAFRYFQDRIGNLANEQGDPLAAKTEFLEKIGQACLVKIEVESHSDAYTLFESLNNRGAPLTAVDLIKNKLLAQIERVDEGNLDHYFSIWNKLITQLGDDYSIQERFFRQYYNAFKDKLNEKFRTEENKNPLGPVATRSNLIHIYEKLITADPQEFLKGIHEASNCYAMMLSDGNVPRNPDLDKVFKDIDRVQASTSYLLLMYLFAHKDALQLSDQNIKRISEILVSFFVRRNLTDTPPTRDLTRLFMAMIDGASSLTRDGIQSYILEQLQSVSASNEVFKNKLMGPIYDENSGVTRFILCYLAEKGMTTETHKDLWAIDGKKFIWTIEHIFPQGENIPASWVSMIAIGDQQLAANYQKSHVHKLGNLTVSAFNSVLSNKSFEDKRDRKDKNGLFVGFKNGFNLNSELANAIKWNVPEIEARTEKLTAQVMSEFNIFEM
jgi:hypothetical protein